MTTIVSYEDFYGKKFERRFTTDIFVFPATAAFAIVRQERTDIGVVINYTNETEPGEPGQLNIALESKGFAPIERYILNLSLPRNIEIATNDTNWTGRVEAQIKRLNDTLFIFSGEVSRIGNISKGGRVLHPLTIRGSVPGSYNIPYHVDYDGKEVSGSLFFRVRGPSIEAVKELSRTSVESGEEVTVMVRISNKGDGEALNIFIADGIPPGIQITEGTSSLNLAALGPGDDAILTYRVKSSSSSSLGGTQISWQDVAGNPGAMELKPISLEVKGIPPATFPPAVTKAPEATSSPTPILKGKLTPLEVEDEVDEGISFSTREGIGVLALTLVVGAIIFKLLTVKVPAKEEE